MDTNTSLTQFYDDLKSKLDQPSTPGNQGMIHIAPPSDGVPSVGATVYRRAAAHECEKLKEKCAKHIVLDIYCKILPLDDDYVAGNQGQMSSDVDSMLAARGTTARQYLVDSSNATKAPMLEFVLRSIDNIGKQFMEKAKEAVEDAEKQDINVPAPEAPEPEEDDGVASALVDVKKDTEYENFIDSLKQKTIKKIVGDISKIITDKKEESEMEFNPKPGAGDAKTESAFSIGMDYLQKKLITENVSLTPEMYDEMMGTAIREATMYEMDRCFQLIDDNLRPFRTRINLGKGAIVNESAATFFVEAGSPRLESLYKEVDGQKYDVSNYEKVGADGSKTPMTDQEAKKVLDPDGYKSYQNRGRSQQTV